MPLFLGSLSSKNQDINTPIGVQMRLRYFLTLPLVCLLASMLARWVRAKYVDRAEAGPFASEVFPGPSAGSGELGKPLGALVVLGDVAPSRRTLLRGPAEAPAFEQSEGGAFAHGRKHGRPSAAQVGCRFLATLLLAWLLRLGALCGLSLGRQISQAVPGATWPGPVH